MNYEGSFGPVPRAESHAAYVFCAVQAGRDQKEVVGLKLSVCESMLFASLASALEALALVDALRAAAALQEG